jgi:hypothetical protein
MLLPIGALTSPELRRIMSRILSPCFRRQLCLLLLVLGPLGAIVFFQIKIDLVGIIESSTTTQTTLDTTTSSNTTVDKKQQQFDIAIDESKKQSKSSSSSSSKDIVIPRCGCPLGPYLTADERAQKEAILRTWCSWLGRQPGFGIGSLKSAREQRIHPQRGPRTWLYYEDPRWPKPKQCYAKGVLRVGERGGNCACCYSSDSVYMTSIHGQVDIYHPSKTGSTTIIHTIKQQMNHSVKAQVYWCERVVTPNVRSSPPLNKKIVNILSTRSPVERLVSGVGELFTRECSNRLWTSSSSGSWNEVSRICKENHDLLIRSSKEKLMECLIREHECHPGYCASEHLFSHGFFVSRGGGGAYKDGPDIDALFRMENLTASLSALPELLDHYTPPPLSSSSSSSLSPLNISTARSSSQKDPAIQEWQTILSHLLTNNTEILQIVCRMYMQDFVCLDLAMPDECTVMLKKALVQG